MEDPLLPSLRNGPRSPLDRPDGLLHAKCNEHHVYLQVDEHVQTARVSLGGNHKEMLHSGNKCVLLWASFGWITVDVHRISVWRGVDRDY